MPFGIDLNPFDDDDEKPKTKKVTVKKKQLPKEQRGLYPPGPGYVHTDRGWVKAKTPEQKKKASPAPPKYVATAYEDREYTPSEAKGKYKDEAKLKREAAAAAKKKKQAAAIERRIAHLQAMEFGVKGTIMPWELATIKPPVPATIDLEHKEGTPWRKPGTAWDGSPIVKNRDGTTSSVRSMSFEEDGREVLVPTVWGGKVHSDKEAIKRYEKTGQHLGKYTSVKEATEAANLIHVQEMQRGVMGFTTIGTAPLTWKQRQKAEQEDRNKRRELVQGALMPGSKDREEFIRRMSPQERRDLARQRRLPQPARPWEPSLSPMEARIPGAAAGKRLGHWAEGLIGPEGAVTKELMASPRQAWELRNLASDLGNAGVDKGTSAAVAAIMATLNPANYSPSHIQGGIDDIRGIAKQFGAYGPGEKDPGNKQYIPGYGWLWGKGTRGQQVGEAGAAVVMGFNKTAEALALAAENQQWLTNTTPAQRAKNQREIKRIYDQGRGAEVGREWITGPHLASAMEGGPMTAMGYVDLVMLLGPGLGFTPAKPVIAVTRAGLKGVRYLPRGARMAMKEATKEYNRINPPLRHLIESNERGQGDVALLLGLKPRPQWRAAYADQVGLRSQAARSRFGRMVEDKLIDPARAALGAKGAPLGTTTHKLATEARKSSVDVKRIMQWPYHRLERAAAKLSLEESYSIRALASGVLPLERQAEHLAYAADADDAFHVYSNLVHADLNEKAARYVEEGPLLPNGEPTVVLREDAPQKLKDAWEYYKAAYERRESTLVDNLDFMTQETIDNRVQATGKLMKGGEWISNEDWAQWQLATSEKRATLVESMYRLVQAGRMTPQEVTDWMTLIDTQLRSFAHRETNKLRRLASVRRRQIARTDDDAKAAEWAMELAEINTKLIEGINPSQYLSDLIDVQTGPGRDMWPQIFGSDPGNISFFAALKHWSEETVDKRLASKLDAKKFHQGLAVNPTVKRRGMTVTGRTTPRAWLQAVNKVVGGPEAQLYWAEWYEDFAGAFEVFGEDALQVMRGFAASQANQAPAGGITSVLKVMDKHRKGEEVTSKGIGMVAKAVSQAVQGSELEKGVAAKLSDFADALAGRQTRTWMGGRVEGGAPAPADIWAARDLGYVDKKHAKRLESVYGLKEGADFVVDSPGAPSGLRYERISEQYQEIASFLNKEKHLGKTDWTPAQVQALGWAKAQMAVGIEPEDLAFALQRNARTISFELTQGPLRLGGGISPQQSHAAAQAMIPEIRALIDDTPGVYFREMSFGVSGWSEAQNGSIHVEVIGSQENIQNMLSRFARAFDQEYVQASREISKSTARASLAIGSDAFRDETLKIAFFKRLHELAPEIRMLDAEGNVVKEGNRALKEKELQGYMPEDFRMQDGVTTLPGIVIRTGRNSVSPATQKAFTDRFAAAIEQAEEELGIEVHYAAKNVELLIGSQYGPATRHARVGSTGGLSSLDDPLESATRERLVTVLDAVQRGERPEPRDVRYFGAERGSELGVPYAVGDDLDDIIEYMGANNRPHILSNKDRHGQPPRIVDVHDPADVPAWSQGHETISIPSGARAIVPGTERPPEYLYRAISEDEWKAIKDNQYMQSDGRMNLGRGEGTVTSLDDPSFYLPGKLASDAPGTYRGRIIRIKYRDEDGWYLGTDGYIKTPEQVPIESIDMVSPPLAGERGTYLSASGQERLRLPTFRPVPYEPDRKFMAGVRPTRFRVVNEEGEVLYSMFSREDAEAAIERLKETHGDWGYKIEEAEGIPDNRYFGAGEAEEVIPATAEEVRDGVVFKVVTLKDDPRLSPGRTAARQGRSGRKRGTKGVRSVTKPHEHHPIAVTEDTSRFYEERRYFAPGEGAHDLVRTEEGDALVHRLVENHPELIKLLWELDPQDAILTEFPDLDTISMSTIERAKDMVRDLTWEHLNEKYPDGVVTLYRGGRREAGEEGLIPWTTRYDLALNTYAKGNPADVRVREVRIGEIEASVVAQQREVPGAWYKGFQSEDEMLLWGDDTSRYMANRMPKIKAGRGSGTGQFSSFKLVPPDNVNTLQALASGERPISGIWVPEGYFTEAERGGNKSRIFLSDQHGTGYTAGHEFFHYVESQLTPRQTELFKKHVGNDPEDAVMAWTTWLLTGSAKGLPSELNGAFQRLSDSTLNGLAQMGWSGSEAKALPREITDLIWTLHHWNELDGGAIRIKDPLLTHTAGVAKEPFHPGMPLSLRQKLWDFHMFSRQQKMSIRGRGPVGAMWAPGGNERKAMKGRLLKSGMFEADVMRGALREMFKASKLETALRTRATFINYAKRSLPNGGRTPSDVTDYAFKEFPNKETAPELKTYWAIVADVDSGMTLEQALRKRKIPVKELEQTHEDAMHGVISEITGPKTVEFEGKVMDTDKAKALMMDRKAAAEKIGENYTGEIEGIIWIPRELVDSSHIFEPPSLQKAKRSSYAPFVKGGVSLVDLMNDLFRVSLLLANPAYYPMNLVGNAVMNLIQQGPFALYNIPRAMTMSYRMSVDEATFVDNLVGEGWIGAAELKSRMLTKPSMALNNVANLLVDRIPRRAAWLHEAMRMGYRSPEELSALIKAAHAGDSAAIEDIQLITRYAKEAMVDFDNLTPFEKDFMTRLIFVYPWLKGSTTYALRFPLNHPVQTAAYAFLYERQQSMANNEIGERPDYLKLFFPFAEQERYGEKYPYGFSLRQMFTFSTTYDIFNTIYGFARGDVTSTPLTEYLQPFYSLALSTATGYDPFLDKKVDRGLGAFFLQLGKAFTTDSPGWGNFQKAFLQSEEDRQRHAEEGRLYPRNRMDDILRFLLGSLAPGPVNPETAQERAREGKAASPEDKTLTWADEAEDTTGHKVPVRYIAIQASKYRYDEIQSEIRREEGTSDLTPWQLTEAKMRTYLEVHPEMEDRRVRWSAAIANADVDVLDDWDEQFSLELGWTGDGGLSEYQTQIDKYKKALEEREHAAAAAK